MLKVVKNFWRACLRIPPESRPCVRVLLCHKLIEETGRVEEKDKMFKKTLKPLDMKRKITYLNFLPEINVQSVASQANIQQIFTCKTNNEASTGNEIQNVSGNTVATQVDFHDINIYVKNAYSTNGEVKIASENEVTNREEIHETFTNNINKEDNAQNNVKDNFSDSNVENMAVEQTLPIISHYFQRDNKISEYQDSTLVKIDRSDQAFRDNLHSLQDMFDRTFVQHCQKNLA